MSKILIFGLAILTVFLISSLIGETFAEEEIPIHLKLNQQSYKIGDPITLQITTDRFIPNTDFQIMIDGDPIDGCTLEKNSLVCTTNIARSYRPPSYDTGCDIIVMRNGTHQIDVYYGKPDNYFSKNSIPINFDEEPNPVFEFISKNYSLNRYDVGTSNTTCEPIESVSDCAINSNLCSINVFQEIVNGGSMSWQIFKDKSSAEEVLEKIKGGNVYDFSYPSFYDVVYWEDQDRIKPFTKIQDGFQCSLGLSDNGRIDFQICLKNNLILTRNVWYGGFSVPDALHYATQKINSAGLPPTTESKSTNVQKSNTTTSGYSSKSIYNKLGIASFVDPKKDPQSYVKRYQNEPTYKTWFDKNYGLKYKSIYEAVGLPEPTKTTTLTNKELDDKKISDAKKVADVKKVLEAKKIADKKISDAKKAEKIKLAKERAATKKAAKAKK